MLTCLVCQKPFWMITSTHLSRHGLTVDEYRRQFGGAIMSEAVKEKKRTVDVDRILSLGIGEKPDGEVAREAGVSARTVCGLRTRMGIPAFIGFTLTQEGIPCRSILEARYDAYLHWIGKPHQHSPRVVGLPYVADFWIDDHYVEIVGMLNYDRYARKVEKKHQAYDEALIPCEWIEPGSLEYICKGCPLPLNFRPGRLCIDCGEESADPRRNRCKKCARTYWERESATLVVCAKCLKTFGKSPGAGNKYCSRECYWSDLKGRKQTPEHVRNATKGREGIKRSPETRARMSAAQKKRFAPVSQRELFS